MIKDFEEFLSDKCDTHTNNSPEGFEKWLEEQDGEEYINYAQEYVNECLEAGILQGKSEILANE